MPAETPAAVTILPLSTRSRLHRLGAARRAARRATPSAWWRARRCSKPARREDQRAGADRRRPRRLLVQAAQPFERRLRARMTSVVAGAARHEHDVGLADLVDAAGRGDLEEARVARDDAGARRDERHLGAGEPRQHLVRSDGVERGEAFVEQDRDLHGRRFLGHPVRESRVVQWRVAARKRWRYAAGGTRTMRRNARRIDSAVPKPHAAATCVDAVRRLLEPAARRLDAHRSTKRAGVMPTSRVNTRAKLRGLMATRARQRRHGAGRRRDGRRSTPAARGAARDRPPARRAGR